MVARLLLVVAVAAFQAAPDPTVFESPYTLDDMRGKQAVVDTSRGTFVIQFLPEAAPDNVALFMKLASEGEYTGTIFHRVVRYGVIQGGDPLSRDPANVADYGQGGFLQLRDTSNQELHTAGAVSTVLVPDTENSGGSQFFVVVTDQTSLDGQHVVFGRIVEGTEVVQAISALDADAEGKPTERVEITAVTIRDTPVEPFVNDTGEELSRYRAVLETTFGEIELQMLADLAPETVRQFLRLAHHGVYDGVLVHRITPNFVIQTGAINFRQRPLLATQRRLVRNLEPEFSNTPNVEGIVSMARGEDPGSASTSFFICIGQCRALDRQYTVFASVARGTDVVDKIASAPRDGEMPRTPIVITGVRIEQP